MMTAVSALFATSGGKWMMLALAGVALFTVGFGSAWRVQGWRADARVAEQLELQLAQTQRQVLAANKEDVKQLVVQETIKTVYVDRIKEITRYEKVAQQINANCVVPVRTVELWDSANQMHPAAAASLTNVSNSGVTLSELEIQHDRESEICNLWIARAKGLTAFYEGQRQALQ